MQDHRTVKRTQKWTASKVIFVIGSGVLLIAASYMAYVAIDEQAKWSSQMTGAFPNQLTEEFHATG